MRPRLWCAPWHTCAVLALLLPVAVLLVAAPDARAQRRAATGEVAVAGEVTDARDGVVDGAPVVVVAATHKGARTLTLIDSAGVARPGPAVPKDAVSFDVCGGGVVFVDGDGVSAADGRRLIARTPLLAVADPALLSVAELCPMKDAPDTLVLVVADGLLVSRGGTEQLLPWPARARAYAGRAPRSLRGERPYAQALSLYAPRLFGVDVDGDADLDLVAVHESRLAFFRRGGDSFALAREDRDLGRLVGAGVDDDVRVRFFGTRAYVSVSKGAVPEKSRVVAIGGDTAAPLSRVERSYDVDGLGVLLGATRQGPVVARIDTTLVALSGVVLTGKVGVRVNVGDREVVALAAAADVRAGKIDGALPMVDVDLGNDGVVDVIDLGDATRVVAHRGSVERDGTITLSEQAPRAVARFGMAVPLRGGAGVVLVGKSGVTVVRF